MSAFPQPGMGQNPMGQSGQPGGSMNFSGSFPLSPAAGSLAAQRNPNPVANVNPPSMKPATSSGVWAAAQEAMAQDPMGKMGSVLKNLRTSDQVRHGCNKLAAKQAAEVAGPAQILRWASKQIVKSAMAVPPMGYPPAAAPPAGPPAGAPAAPPAPGGSMAAPPPPGAMPPPAGPPGAMMPPPGPPGAPPAPGMAPPPADPSMAPVPAENAQLAPDDQPLAMPVLTGMSADPDVQEPEIDEAMKYDKMVTANSKFEPGSRLAKLYERRPDLLDDSDEKTAMQKQAHPAVRQYLHDTLKNHAKPDPVGEKYAEWTYLNYRHGFGHPAERAARQAYERAAHGSVDFNKAASFVSALGSSALDGLSGAVGGAVGGAALAAPTGVLAGFGGDLTDDEKDQSFGKRILARIRRGGRSGLVTGLGGAAIGGSLGSIVGALASGRGDLGVNKVASANCRVTGSAPKVKTKFDAPGRSRKYVKPTKQAALPVAPQAAIKAPPAQPIQQAPPPMSPVPAPPPAAPRPPFQQPQTPPQAPAQQAQAPSMSMSAPAGTPSLAQFAR